MTFQHVPAGSFLMGQRGEYADEEPAHTAAITRDFYLGTFPVTQEQFAVWTASAAHREWLATTGKRQKEDPHKNGFPGHPRHPAEQVSWHLAAGFCRWVEKNAQGLLPGFRPWLPTEAEREYACRWRTDGDAPCSAASCASTEYYNGDGEAALAEIGWYDRNSASTTHAVDERPETHPLGVCGMHGNVWEWCADVWDQRAYCSRPDAVSDPGAAKRAAELDEKEPGASRNHPHRVLRGGSWFCTARDCRAAYRYRYVPGDRFGLNGFRLVLVPGSGGTSGAERQQTSRAEPATGDGGRGTSPQAEGAGGAIDFTELNGPRSGRKFLPEK